MKKCIQPIAAIVILFSAISVSAQHQFVKVWETAPVFKVPESVLLDASSQTLFVANIDTINGSGPWSKDGRGSIGKMSANGKDVKAEWVTGLEAPKGMGIYNGKLYVADITNVVVIDINGAKIEKTIAIPNAENLNDLTIDKSGIVYVSDSRGRKIYKVKDGVAEVYVDGLRNPNGVLAHNNDFYILDNGTLLKVNADKTTKKVVEGMDGGTDGIENLSGDEFIVSAWGGIVYLVNTATGSKEVLLDSRADKANAADIAVDKATKTVFVPTFWKNTIAAYQVK